MSIHRRPMNQDLKKDYTICTECIFHREVTEDKCSTLESIIHVCVLTQLAHDFVTGEELINTSFRCEHTNTDGSCKDFELLYE